MKPYRCLGKVSYGLIKSYLPGKKKLSQKGFGRLLLKVSEFSCQSVLYHKTLDLIRYELYWRSSQFFSTGFALLSARRTVAYYSFPTVSERCTSVVKQCPWWMPVIKKKGNGKNNPYTSTLEVETWTCVIPPSITEPWETEISLTPFFWWTGKLLHVARKLKSYWPLLLRQLLKSLCHLTC